LTLETLTICRVTIILLTIHDPSCSPCFYQPILVPTFYFIIIYHNLEGINRYLTSL